MRFTIAVDVELAHQVSSTDVAHEIIDYVVQSKNWEAYLKLHNIHEDGQTTDRAPYPLPRYHFSATTIEPTPFVPFKGRRSLVTMSYVQDANFPEVTFRISTPSTRFYSRAIRVKEHQRGNQTFLEVKCDVVIEYKFKYLLSSCSGSSNSVQGDHEALLNAMKADIERRYEEPSQTKL